MSEASSALPVGNIACQLKAGAVLPVTVLPAGTAAPTMGEGDSTATYFTPARTGVGVYTLTTRKKFPAVVAAHPTVLLGSGVDAGATLAPIVKNADGTQTITVNVITASTGAALELDNGNGDMLMVTVFLRTTGT